MYEILKAMNDIDDEYILCYDFCGIKRRKRRIRHAVLAAAAVFAIAATAAILSFGIAGGKGNEPQQGGIAVLDVTETDTESVEAATETYSDRPDIPSNYEFEAIGEARLDMRGTDWSQEKSIELYQKLMKYYGVYDSMDPYPHYDDNFGGAFISDDGYLVIALCDTSEEEVERITGVIGDSGYIIRPCQYSYNELIDTIKRLNNCLPDIIQEGIHVSCVYENVRSNRVIVGIEDISDYDVVAVKRYVDEPYIEFMNIEREIEVNTSIRGGYFITSSSTNTCSTLGFCAINSGNYEGFVISGHDGDNYYENFTYNGTTLGYVTATAYNSQSLADAAFLTKGANVDVTAYCGSRTVDCVSSSATEYPAGTQVQMYNSNTGTMTGTIQSLYYISVRPNGWLFPLQTRTTLNVEEGDSGSPVYIPMSNNKCKILGIIATGGHDNDGYYSTFSKYCYIAQALSLSAITDSYFD